MSRPRRPRGGSAGSGCRSGCASPSSTSRSPSSWCCRFNERDSPSAWKGFSLQWYPELFADADDPAGAAQHADRRRWAATADRDRARHAARLRLECATRAVEAASTRSSIAPAILPDIVLAIGAALVLLRCRTDARPALGDPRPRRLRPRLRRRGGARPAEELRPGRSTRPRRPRRRPAHHLPAGDAAVDRAGSRRRRAARLHALGRRVRHRLLHRRRRRSPTLPMQIYAWSASASRRRSTPWPPSLLLVSVADACRSGSTAGRDGRSSSAPTPLLAIDGVAKRLRRRSPLSTASRSTSATTSSSRCSARRAAARRRCCACSPASRRPTTGRIVLDGEDMLGDAARTSGRST